MSTSPKRRSCNDARLALALLGVEIDLVGIRIPTIQVNLEILKGKHGPWVGAQDMAGLCIGYTDNGVCLFSVPRYQNPDIHNEVSFGY